MASENVNDGSDVESAHASLCTQATYQIEAMCSALLKAAQSPDAGGSLPYLVQGLAIRIDALNGAMMHAVDGDPEMIESLRSEVFGPHFLEVTHG